MAKLPLIVPCVVSAMVSNAVAVDPAAKHEDGEAKLNVVTLSVCPFCFSVDEIPKAVLPSEFSRPAVQFPVSGFWGAELNPQPSNTTAIRKMIAVQKRFMGILREADPDYK